MPIYAYECTQCGHHFDRLQKLSDPDPTQCPACQQESLRRQLTAPVFRLAGGGWYETDFKKDGDRKRNLADAGEAKSGDGKGAGEATTGTGKAEPAKPSGDSAPAAKPADSKPTAAAS